jgi:sphingomyelin phosphodiesterase acid-like 3
VLVAIFVPCSPQKTFIAPPPETQVLLISDIHFDPTADRGELKQLIRSPSSEWASILSGSPQVVLSSYSHDTNWWLFFSALSYIKSTLPKPAFVLMTGDFLAHDLESKFKAAVPNEDEQAYRGVVRKTMEFIAAELRQAFPNTPIICTLGNNDNDGPDYALQPRGFFLRTTEPLIRDLAFNSTDADFTRNWTALGSFSAHLPSLPGYRVLSLNTNFLSAKYKSKATHPADDPGGQVLDWLDSELKTAETAGEKAWLIFHIPPGIDGFATDRVYRNQQLSHDLVPMWQMRYQKRFESILQAHARCVRASFAAHTHMDEFRLLQGGNFISLTPAISPSNGENPAFRKLLVGADGTLSNAETYYLNLAAASAIEFPAWMPEYNFRAAWGAPRIDRDALARIYEASGTTAEGEDKWVRQYSVQHQSLTDMPQQTFRALYCANGTIDPDAFESCYHRK